MVHHWDTTDLSASQLGSWYATSLELTHASARWSPPTSHQSCCSTPLSRTSPHLLSRTTRYMRTSLTEPLDFPGATGGYTLHMCHCTYGHAPHVPQSLLGDWEERKILNKRKTIQTPLLHVTHPQADNFLCTPRTAALVELLSPVSGADFAHRSQPVDFLIELDH